MSCRHKPLVMRGFYFITDETLSRSGTEHDVAVAASCGCAMIQFRSKSGGSRAMYDEAMKLKLLSGTVPFIVNDRVDIALAVHADGVHLGQNDLPAREARRLMGEEAIIGVSVSSPQQAIAAEEARASYIAVSPVFSTATKGDAGPGLGLAMLSAIRSVARLPLAVIGGVTLERAKECLVEGADLVCAIGATVTRSDLHVAIAEFKEVFQ